MKLYIHTTNLFLSNEGVPKSHKHTIYILTKRKLNKKFPNVYTSHDAPYDFTCIIKCKDFSHDFHINYYVKVNAS
jgi:hypothetical protein